MGVRDHTLSAKSTARQIMRKVGLSRKFCMEVIRQTRGHVEAWQAAHGVTGESSRATAQAVKRQATDALLATPEFAGATDAQKQEFADALLVQSVLIRAMRDQAKGDAALLRQIAAAVRQGAGASGLDLDAMTLTDEGFVPTGRVGGTDPSMRPDGEEQALVETPPEMGRAPSGMLLAAAGGMGLGAAFLIGKMMERRG